MANVMPIFKKKIRGRIWGVAVLGKTIKQVLMEDIFKSTENRKVFGTATMGLTQASCVQSEVASGSLNEGKAAYVVHFGLGKCFKDCLPWLP